MLALTTAPFWVADGLYNAADQNDLGLSRPQGMQTVTVFAPTADTDQFSNGVCMTAFQGNLYCMWQSSRTDEDSADTWVAYARSTDDGATWSQPMTLAATIPSGSVSSGGWHVYGDELIAYINTWNQAHTQGYTRYVTSSDGLNWSEPADVLMADGTRMEAIFEQDPHVLASGRIVNAAHFAPGLFVYPIYTDDPSGKGGWHRAAFTPTRQTDLQSRELEPSLYVQPDGTLVMMFRDQKSTFTKLAATSADQGETWSDAIQTQVPDSRSKQCAGNLPDGTSYFVSNPVGNKDRWPLVLTLSADGSAFDHAWLLRSKDEMQSQRYTGKAKRPCYSYPKAMVAGDYLYISYATNKEDVEYSRVPLISVQLVAAIEQVTTDQAPNAYYYDLTGRRQLHPTAGQIYIYHGRKIKF